MPLAHLTSLPPDFATQPLPVQPEPLPAVMVRPC